MSRDRVELPVDADGQPIRAGDLMETQGLFAFVVDEMVVGRDGEWRLRTSRPNGHSGVYEYSPREVRHARDIGDYVRELERKTDGGLPRAVCGAIHSAYWMGRSHGAAERWAR